MRLLLQLNHPTAFVLVWHNSISRLLYPFGGIRCDAIKWPFARSNWHRQIGHQECEHMRFVVMSFSHLNSHGHGALAAISYLRYVAASTVKSIPNIARRFYRNPSSVESTKSA